MEHRLGDGPIDIQTANILTMQGELKRIASALEAQNDPAHATTESQRAEDDLAAQQDMAKWAFGVFVVSALSLILSAGGILLIWRTLFHTRRTADAAIASHQAFMVAEDASLDPHFTVHAPAGPGGVPVLGTGFGVSAAFTNIGRSAATIQNVMIGGAHPEMQGGTLSIGETRSTTGQPVIIERPNGDPASFEFAVKYTTPLSESATLRGTVEVSTGRYSARTRIQKTETERVSRRVIEQRAPPSYS